MSAFIESAIRFDFASALRTLTFTICPALTASEGSFMKRFESSLGVPDLLYQLDC
jgi:hypothetical protein